MAMIFILNTQVLKVVLFPYIHVSGQIWTILFTGEDLGILDDDFETILNMFGIVDSVEFILSEFIMS